ncbi:MAG: hypothetical protein ACOC22_02920 [bacterium]
MKKRIKFNYSDQVEYISTHEELASKIANKYKYFACDVKKHPDFFSTHTYKGIIKLGKDDAIKIIIMSYDYPHIIDADTDILNNVDIYMFDEYSELMDFLNHKL